MNFADLHCDTIYECITKKQSLKNNNLAISIEKSEVFENWWQCFAVWMPDDGFLKKNFVFKSLNFWHKEILKYENFKFCTNKKDFDSREKIKAILTVEGSYFLENLSDLKKAYDLGVRILTLTWNGKTFLGDGNKVKNPSGLTDFGKCVLRKMSALGMIVDVSHASDRLFYDTVEILSGKPFVATHSNSRSICSHKRNITDEQFLIIKKSDGIVGLNFCSKFLVNNEIASISDVLRHAEHFLELGGEKNLCIGSDFDGLSREEICSGVSNIDCIPMLYKEFSKYFGEKISKDIFFNNAKNFFLNNFPSF
ncbi:MAG: dipeptidase [Oscillospiraceae bacterium]|nr:dipeptidase [Oscillospiraceae bacterium]